MAVIPFDHLAAPSRRLAPVAAGLGVALLAGLAAFVIIETQGHDVTGMTARVPWGLPHVFAYFMILAAPGALNVALIASVFRREAYRSLEPFAALLAIGLLAGGLCVLVLDLGRPDRLLLTTLFWNPRSIFAWNIILYTGFLAVTAAYLVTLLDGRYRRYGGPVTHIANVWRILLTTGTGCDLGVLVARDLVHSAIMAPMFIAFALTYGLAVFLLLWPAMAWLNGGAPDRALMQRLGRLLALFVAIALYFAVVMHAVNLYAPGGRALERFLLVDGGVYTALVWGGQVVLGTAVPLLLIYARQPVAAAAAVVAGAFATLYLTMTVAQAFPQPLLPGMAISSNFGDGTVAGYMPSLAELLLGLGGVAVALAVVLAGCLTFRIVPTRLAGRGRPALKTT